MSPDLRTAGSRVIELGGRSVHLLIQPGEGPPVVLLGGCAVPSYAFADVVDMLRDRWTVSLDRPGLVQTRWPGVLPTLEQEVATLVALGESLGEPAVMVGHSMAGPHVEALARQRPDLVAGLVLLDGSVEFEPRRPGSGAAWLKAAQGVRCAAGLAPLAAVGALGARVLFSVQSARRRLTDARPKLARELFRRPDTLAMVVAEQAAYAAQLWDLDRRRREQPWPGTPTLILTAAGDGGPSWVRVQARLARLLGGQQVVIEHARHLVMIDRPDVVADAVSGLSRSRPQAPRTEESPDE